MNITSLIHMAGYSSPNRFLIESLNRDNSQVLTIQQRDFHKALREKGSAEVFCFYETLESPTVQRVCLSIVLPLNLVKLTQNRINLATGK